MYEIEIISETGENENQDRVKVIRKSDNLLIIIADGAGGIAYGSHAAEKAIQYIVEHEINNTEMFECNKWVKVISEIDKLICADNESGETTLVVTAIKKNFFCGASVGDSGVWNIHADKLIDITENQYRKPLVGSGLAMPVPFEKYNYNGSLLIATDGLLKYAEKQRIIKSNNIKCIKAAAKEMIDSVRLKSGSLWDDTTFVLYR